jgi:hypothetical protein
LPRRRALTPIDGRFDHGSIGYGVIAASPSGVTRKTAKRLAEHLGVDETQAIHLALHELVAKVLPQYERDEGPLSGAQMRHIKKRVAQGTKHSVRSSLVEMKSWSK